MLRIQKIAPLLAIIILCNSYASMAQYKGKSAIGLRLSTAPAIVNNAISFKYFLTERNAVEAIFSFGEPISFGALYEVHTPISTPGLQWYYGGGGYVGFDKTYNLVREKNETDIMVGAMGVLGLDYKFPNLPLNLSLDWKPELNIIESIQFEPAALGLSVRFAF